MAEEIAGGIPFTMPGFTAGASQDRLRAHLDTVIAAFGNANRPGGGVFAGDGLLAFGRTMGFLHDAPMIAAINKAGADDQERSMVWRSVTGLWAARQAVGVPGDFVECGAYRGYTAFLVSEVLDAALRDRRYWLYDLYENPGGPGQGQTLPDHSADLVDQVRARFADKAYVSVIQGRLPDVLASEAPEHIAFLHVDLNDAEAEAGTLAVLFDRVVPGGTILFDDFGWHAYWRQHVAVHNFMAERGYPVLELPTGQGLVVKRP